VFTMSVLWGTILLQEKTKKGNIMNNYKVTFVFAEGTFVTTVEAHSAISAILNASEVFYDEASEATNIAAEIVSE
jgi:hypothetical protein